MRKIVAVVLAVLMLASVLAMLPASAATATYDGTTKTTTGLNKIMITEIAPTATYHPNGVAESQNDAEFPMNFMEIYNNNAGTVNLSTKSILQAANFPTEPNDETDPYLDNPDGNGVLWRRWRDSYKFTAKIDIKLGAIVDEATAKATGQLEDTAPATPALDNRIYSMLVNSESDLTLENGEIAVIWFISPVTISWMIDTDNKTVGFDAREAFVKSFYGANANVADYNIVMVWGYSDFQVNDATKLASDMFMLSANTKEDRDYIYGIADNDWSLNNDKAYDATNGLNEKLYNTATMGYSVPRYNGFAVKDLAMAYGLPTAKPYIANAYEALTEINPTVFNEAFSAGLVKSFRESAAIDCAAKATPGTMPAWQWAMVSPETYEGFKTNGAFDATKVEAAVNAYIVELKLIDNSTGREETDERDYNFQTQEELKNQFYNNNKKKDTEDEGGMSTVVLVIIIVAAVVVVGGGAAAAFIIIKKKAPAVAAEAPATEAPAEEEKSE